MATTVLNTKIGKVNNKIIDHAKYITTKFNQITEKKIVKNIKAN